MKVLRQAAARAVDRARDLGATGCEILLRSETTLTWSTERGRGTPTRRMTAAVRVYEAAGRLGIVGQVVTGVDAVAGLVDRAAAAAASAPPSDHLGPPQRLDIPTRGLSISDPRHPRIDDEARAEVVDSNTEACRAVGDAVGGCAFFYEEAVTARVFASSRNVDALETSTRFRLAGRAWAAHDGDLVAQGVLESRQFADVASRPLGVDLGRRVAAFGNPAELPLEPRPVVLSPHVASAFLPLLVEAFRGQRIDTGNSFLAGRIGTAIGSDSLHLIDDASAPGGLATRGFDDRGVPPVVVPLIREGHAASMYRAPHRARMQDARPTGHERADGTLWPGNLVVRPGNRSRNMLFPLLGRFVIAEELLDGASIDPRTGAVRLPVHAFLADADGVHGYLGRRVLVTDAFEMLRSVTHMASDQERHGIVDTASWVLEGPWFA